MVKVYGLNIKSIEKYFDNVKNILSKERLEKFNKYKKYDDKLRCLASGILLNEYIGKENVNKIKYVENGKPYIENGIHFNISHSGEYVVIAIDNNIVGIDIEKREDRQVDKLIKKVFTNEEQNYIAKQEDKIGVFYKLWTLKESYMKYTGKGLSISPDKIEFCIKDNDIKLKDDIKDLSFYVNETHINGYTISLCTSQKNYDSNIEIVRM